MTSYIISGIPCIIEQILKVFREQSLSEARNNSKNPEPLPGLFKVTRARPACNGSTTRAFMTIP
jgi:hypothetical protein